MIENVAGAGGSTALTRAARAEADGYTIAIGNAGTSAATYTIYPKLPFTPDPSCRSRWSRRPSASSRCARIFRRRTCRNSSPTRRSNPGKINLGHAGVGSSNFLICKSFVQAAGIDVTLVGYRGAAPALTDAIGGQIDGVCDAAASGVAGDRRQAGEGPRGRLDGAACDLPDLPTSAEAGLPEFEAQGWNGLFAPKGTPPAIIAKLNAAAQDRGGKRGGEEALCTICRRSRPTPTSMRRKCCSNWWRATSKNTASCWRTRISAASRPGRGRRPQLHPLDRPER